MQATPTKTAKMDAPLCLPLDAAGATLARTGGKGLNLTKLAQAGFPVPGGFIVTTDGYDAVEWTMEQVEPLEHRFLDLVARDRPPAGTPSAQRLR